jgi:hypothetical protein
MNRVDRYVESLTVPVSLSERLLLIHYDSWLELQASRAIEPNPQGRLCAKCGRPFEYSGTGPVLCPTHLKEEALAEFDPSFNSGFSATKFMQRSAERADAFRVQNPFKDPGDTDFENGI